MEDPWTVSRRIASALLLLVVAGVVWAQDSDGLERYYEVDTVNPGLAPVEPPANLETPQACLENFFDACEAGDFDRAAHSLDFRLVAAREAQLEPTEAVRRLVYVLNQKLWIDWDALPDRPDGMLEAGPLGQAPPLVGEPRRSLRLGWISMPERRVPVRLDRVKPADGEPRWLISAHTVDNIDRLYEVHGPTWLALAMPEWARARGPGRVLVWQWLVIAVTLLVGTGGGWLAGSKLVPLALGFAGDRWCRRLRWPIGMVVGSTIVWVSVSVLTPLPSAVASIVDPLTLVFAVFAGAWLAMRVLSDLIDGVVAEAVRRRVGDDDPAQGRTLTQLTVLRHGCALVVALVGIGIALHQLSLFETVGVALLTSAGAAAVVLGVAGHAVLGNLVASVQIALTQPFRLGDTVIVHGEWGKIEEITYTYVTVCTWDERRLIVPLRYFVTDAFENWSKTDEFLVKPVYIHVDFRADVGRIRDKFEELVASHEQWVVERTEPKLLVVDTSGDNLKLRFTAGTNGVADAWQMSCTLREELVAWLQQEEDGSWLPRERFEVSGDSPATPLSEIDPVEQEDVASSGGDPDADGD